MYRKEKQPMIKPDDKLTIAEFAELDHGIAEALRSYYDRELNDDGNGRTINTWEDMDKLLGPISWDWQPWLVKAMLTIVASESGVGKSALMLRIAESYLTGADWPDGQPFEEESGKVLWAEAEAAQAINLERAKSWGLPLENILTPLDPLEDLRLSVPDHKATLATIAMNPEVKLIIVDSLSGADARAEKSSEDALTVQWLAALARDAGKPILVSHHLRKRSLFDGDRIDLDRLRGSSAIVQTARLVWTLDVPDPQARDWKRLQVVKSNLARLPEPLGLTIDGAGVQFGDAPEEPKMETLTDKAADLLMALLAHKPMLATDIQDEVEQAGISWRTVKRAKKSLGILSLKKDNGWLWSLPARDYEN